MVSVILPTFNREKLLKQAIDSVFAQSFENWELIIIDDGSEDDTFKLVDNYLMDDRRVKYIKQNNRGLPISLNAGIANSTGEWITFLGSDDKYKPDHLSYRVDCKRKYPEIDLFHGGVEIIGDEYVADKDDPNKKVHLSECTIGGTFFGKRKVFTELEGFKDIPYSEDSELLERAESQFNIKKIDYPSYVYNRLQTDSITNNYK
jgi:cellulose synthase/poly-beta-1,6-N-acetylglucosamine synthase-like glycosyltransferase